MTERDVNRATGPVENPWTSFDGCSWQPMSTAPKNAPVLVWFTDGEMEVARWSWSDRDLGWWSNDGLDYNYGFDKPLYWMPLPPPPRVPDR